MKRKAPQYKFFKKDIYKRDNYTCQLCSSKAPFVRITIHHIKVWKDNHKLRYDPHNCITLCQRCHASVKGKEEEYEVMFIALLRLTIVNLLRRLCLKKKL